MADAQCLHHEPPRKNALNEAQEKLRGFVPYEQI